MGAESARGAAVTTWHYHGYCIEVKEFFGMIYAVVTMPDGAKATTPEAVVECIVITDAIRIINAHMNEVTK